MLHWNTNRATYAVQSDARPLGIEERKNKQLILELHSIRYSRQLKYDATAINRHVQVIVFLKCLWHI